MAPKEAKKNKRGKGRLSGNPASRAEQLETTEPNAHDGKPMELSNLPGELELGLPPPDRTWWRRSHDQVLSSAPRWLPDAEGPRDLENRVCALLGHQWHRRIIAGHGGLLRGGWLEELLDRWDTSHTTDDAASRDTDPDADDSDVGGRVVGSWLLLRGLAIGSMAEAEGNRTRVRRDRDVHREAVAVRAGDAGCLWAAADRSGRVRQPFGPVRTVRIPWRIDRTGPALVLLGSGHVRVADSRGGRCVRRPRPAFDH